MAGIPVAVAILVGLFSSFIQSLGLTIQRKSHLNNSSLPFEKRKKPIKRPLWLIGFGIYITSNIFSTIFQLDSLPIIILAPLGAISLIYNAILSKFLLKDKFGKNWLIGTSLISLGAILIAIFGVVKEDSNEENHHTLDEILILFKRSTFLIFFSILSFLTFTVIIISHLTVFHVHRQISKIQLPLDPSNESGRSTPVSIVPSNAASPHSNSTSIPFRFTKPRRWSSPTSSSIPLPKSFTPKSILKPKHNQNLHLEIDPPPNCSDQIKTMMKLNEKQQKKLTLCGLGFASASGTLSGMCLVLAKAAVELLVLTINYFRTNGQQGKNELLRIQTWFLVLGLGICAILQLVYLNYSLTFASPAIICPLAFCFFNLSSIFDGLVFYDQFSKLSTLKIIIVSLGVAILLLGVWVVSAIQPDSAVDIGTWVEEESDTESLLTFEGNEDVISSNHNLNHEHVDPLSPSTSQFPNQIQDGNLISSPTISELGFNRSIFTSPNPNSNSTPTSPMSPNTRRKHHHHHRMRYGSLVSDLPTGAPTGFSIGLGASSPGFALRTGNFSIDGNFHPHPHPIQNNNHSIDIENNSSSSSGEGIKDLWGKRRRFKSKSENQRDLQNIIIQGNNNQTRLLNNHENQEEQEVNNAEENENVVEGELRNWTEVRKRTWWERLFSPFNNGEEQGQGRIRLDD
ncbi:uncharacterized protein I206_103929 [Kwoniella pini CBS 10737]|uniref:Uncharacterized protein n=1 Tax=Kwoniella pini CBS 10737 TaxID=1296096 RepID=A0A1B9I352_9TREE|nr:uncharacterized protein I206_04498 [Kwoniella pini CBS 10737]OCF49967.1 hypothetical protein I206_04498 [Kwoniella pini CBS 10737]